MIPGRSVPGRRLQDVLGIAERFCADGTDAGIALYAEQRGEVILEAAVGRTDAGEDLTTGTKFLYLSASKPLTAVAVALLVERGLLAWSDPLARHIPELAEGPKALMTVEHLLTHRAGIPDFFGKAMDETDWHDWDTGVKATIDLPLEYAPGTRTVYHGLSFGLLGELVPRLDGRSFRDFFAVEIAEPFGMESFSWGLPADDSDPWTGIGLPGQEHAEDARRFQTPELNAAVLPAGNGWGTARDLGRFYAALAGGGGGVLSPATVERMIRPNPILNLDAVQHAHGYGFELGSASGSADTSPLGDLAGPRVFGHPGMRSTVGWADADRGLAVAILRNGALPPAEGQRRLAMLSDGFHRAAAG